MLPWVREMHVLVNNNLNVKNILTLESIMKSIFPVVINHSQIHKYYVNGKCEEYMFAL